MPATPSPLNDRRPALEGGESSPFRSAFALAQRVRRLDVAVAVAIFAILAIGFLNPVFRSDATFSTVAGHQTIQYPWAIHPTGFPDVAQSDQADYLYPIQADLNRSLRAGEFPWWSPYSFGGTPSIGNVGYAIGLYPPKLFLSLIAPPVWVHDLMMLLHIWLAGLATYLFVRRLGASFAAGVLAGVAWMFCPTWFVFVQFETNAVVAALLPLALWLVHRAIFRRSFADAVACAATLALLTVGGSVQPAVFCFLIVCGYGLALGLRPLLRAADRRREAIRVGALVAVAGGLGVMLSAFLLLPASADVSASGRAKLPYAAMEASGKVPWRLLLHVFDDRVPALNGTNIWFISFLGAPVALLALAGVASRRPGATLGRWLVAIFLLLVLATPLTEVAYHVVPGFAYLSPLGRLDPYLAFGVILLAAVGLDEVLHLIGRLSRHHRTVGIVAAATLCVVAIGLEGWQTMTYGRDANAPFQPRDTNYLYPTTPLIVALQSRHTTGIDGRVERIAVVRGGPSGPAAPVLDGEVLRLFGLENLGGYLNVLPPRERALAMAVSGVDPATAVAPSVGGYIAYFFADTTRFSLLNRIGVTELVAGADGASQKSMLAGIRQLGGRPVYTGADGTVWHLPKSAPRAFVVDGVDLEKDEFSSLQRFVSPAFAFRRDVLFDGADASGLVATPGTPIDAKVRVLPGSDDEVRLSVSSPRAGWVVLLDSWSKGWSARVNGKATPVRRADFAFRAMRVPAGTSLVTMTYRAPGLVLGIIISTLGALVAVLILAISLVGWRRRRPTPDSA